jgi:hypothetical protein
MEHVVPYFSFLALPSHRTPFARDVATVATIETRLFVPFGYGTLVEPRGSWQGGQGSNNNRQKSPLLLKIQAIRYHSCIAWYHSQDNPRMLKGVAFFLVYR